MDAVKIPATLLAPEWIWRYAIAFGIFLQLWLGKNYVTRAEYATDRQDLSRTLTALSGAVTTLTTSIELLKASSSQWADHEVRIRTLEQKR